MEKSGWGGGVEYVYKRSVGEYYMLVECRGWSGLRTFYATDIIETQVPRLNSLQHGFSVIIQPLMFPGIQATNPNQSWSCGFFLAMNMTAFLSENNKGKNIYHIVLGESIPI